MIFGLGWWPWNESNNSSPSSRVHEKVAKQIKINTGSAILSVAFLADGKYIVSGGKEGKIQYWRVEDGSEVGPPTEAGGVVCNLAVSLDDKWVVSGTRKGKVRVWSAESHQRASTIKGQSQWVYAVDVSPDGASVATGSGDYSVSVWSRLTGSLLLGPLLHPNVVCAVKFSPDGRLIATATWHGFRIYDSQDGRLLAKVSITVGSQVNHSLAWASDSERLFVLSLDGSIHCFDVTTKAIRSQWPTHSNRDSKCISLASNDRFIAVSADSSVSFWDTMTQKQIGSVVQHTASIMSMAISANCDLVIGGGEAITVRGLHDILPPSYTGDIFTEEAGEGKQIEKVGPEETNGNSDNEIARLEETVRQLQNLLSESQSEAAQEKDRLNATIDTLRTQNKDASDQLAASKNRVDTLNKTIESLRAREKKISNEIAPLKQQLREHDDSSQRKADSLVRILHAHEKQHQCRLLSSNGHMISDIPSLLEITNAVGEKVTSNGSLTDWFAEFKSQCVSMLETAGDEALRAEGRKEAIEAYSAALLHCPSTPDTLLMKWAGAMLICSSPNDALTAAALQFKFSIFLIYRAICNVLERDGRVEEAIEYFRQMQDELGDDTICHGERAQWELDFQQQCAKRLGKLGDVAMGNQNYNEAVQHFSATLSLDLPGRMEILIKRSEARAMMECWEEALSDADEAIKLDPSSHRGYERRHAALHGAKHYSDAVGAFHMMLVKMDHSRDPHVRELRQRYSDATPTIRRIVTQTTRHMPRMLINTSTGHLYDKQQQAAAFEELPIYNELVSSMTTNIDYGLIRRVVKRFYRYVMLSHKWEHNEPLLQKVENISIDELEPSPENDKLKKFCSLVYSLGFHWAWSDTCCVDKLNNVILQEALVAMFTWYRGSSLTVVYLRDVSSESQRPGDLRESIWNTRAWTYQEYVAAEVVRFYTEDWKPYLDLTLANHKDEPAIVLEMQQATGISTEEMATLRPGLDRVREKLYLASQRQTTLVEDIAYSLYGIFNVALPAIYGEGDRAVGRLLEYILTGSGDVTILAWTGRVGTYNSCLPMDLTVYEERIPPQIPQPVGKEEMEQTIANLRSSSADSSLAVRLFDQLHGLHSPSISANRLRLPGIVFHLTKLVHTSGPDPETSMNVYHAMSSVFGLVEIKTADSLDKTKDFYLIHPWIRPLLDQEFLDGARGLDKTTQAFRLVARLRQRFGALLLEPVTRIEYKRVAADSLIMVQVREDVPLTELIENIRTIEVQ